MIKQEVSEDSIDRLDRVLIEKSWLIGGASSINLSYVRNNVFHYSTWGSHLYIVKDVVITTVFENNKHPDGGAVVISQGK